VVSPAEKPPYPGLRPFERDESHLFFGRDHCIDDMVKRLAERRFLAVLGSSGTGKSSLVRTGLFSALEMGLLPGAGSRWLIVDFRPGGNPLGNLARALLEAECAVTKKPAPSAAEVATLQQRLKQEGPRELIKWSREGHLAEGANLLVLVDQFEELFRYQSAEGREDAQALVTLLLESRWPRGLASPQRAETPIYVAITLRSEYLGACALIWGLPEAINEGTYLTPRMKRQECEEAILGPARVCGLDVEPQLVTRLLNDMADFAPWDSEGGKDQLTGLARSADQLPLMQHALNQMWLRAREQCEDGEEIVLKLTDYRGLEQELDSHAEHVLLQLGAAGRTTAERVFRAVTQGTTLANAVRRPTKYGPGVASAGPQQPHAGAVDGGGPSSDRQPQEAQPQEAQPQEAEGPEGRDDLIDICGGPQSRNAVADVVAAFGPNGCQFLTANPRPAKGAPADDDAWIDIAHESLIRQWKRLSGWLEKEGQAARQWQQLREKADKNDWLRGHTLLDARKFRKESEPTRAWAARYGGEFERVVQFIRRSERRQWSFIGVGLALLAIVAALGVTTYRERQQSDVANQKVVQAARSAQKLVDQLSTSWSRGDITLKGANDMLQVAGNIVGTTSAGTGDLAPLIKLALTSSDLYGDLGNDTEAAARAREAKKFAEQLAAAKPNDKEALGLLYRSVWRVADQLANDQATSAEGLAQFLAAKTLALRIKDLPPVDGADDREIMFMHQKIGDIYLDRDGFDTAEDEFRAAWDSIQEALKKGTNPDWRRDAAVTRRRIANALTGKKDFVGALEQFTAAIKELTAWLENTTDNDIGWSNLAGAHRELGDWHQERKEYDEALGEYGKSMEIQKRLNDKDPSYFVPIRSLAVSNRQSGRALRQQGRFGEAVESYEKARAFREQLFNKDRANRTRQSDLATADMEAADAETEFATHLDAAAPEQTRMRDQNLADAVKLYRVAISIFDELRPRYDTDVFNCYTKVGDIYILQADPDSALAEYRTASGIALDKASTEPINAAWQRGLVNSYVKMGDILAEKKSVPEAIKQYESAINLTKVLAQRYPQNTEWPSKAEELKKKMDDLAPNPSTQVSAP
jgi:tetratricopeptide (TPR) repeat protein